MFSFVFWKKVKTPKRNFEINWPLDAYMVSCPTWSKNLAWNLSCMVTWQGRRNLKWHYYYWPSQILWPSASPSWHSMYIKTQPIHQKQAKIFLSMSDSPNASQWSIIENSIQKLEIAKTSMVKKMLKNSRKKHVRNFLLAFIIDESLKYFQFFYAIWK